MLQGSLGDFALDEILGLLAATSKSGQLDIKGDRGAGLLIFNGGKLGEARASNCEAEASAEDVMFELLRYNEGSFVFSHTEVGPTGEEKNVAGVLSVAESRIADWQTIAEVVPSLQHIAVPCEGLPDDEITINRSEWNVLRSIASECEVSVVCEELELGEVEGSRTVKHLIERGLVSLREPGVENPPTRVPDRQPITGEFEALSVEEITNETTDETPELVSADVSDSENDSLVASLRGVSADGESARPASVPPLPSRKHSGPVPSIEPEVEHTVTQESAADDGGLLMRYLKGEES